MCKLGGFEHVGIMRIPDNKAASQARVVTWNFATETLSQIVTASRDLCNKMRLEAARSCTVSELTQKVFNAPACIRKWQGSSAIGGARYALAFALS